MNKQQEKIIVGAMYRRILTEAFGTPVTVTVKNCTKTKTVLTTTMGQVEIHILWQPGKQRCDTITRVTINDVEVHEGSHEDSDIIQSIKNNNQTN